MLGEALLIAKVTVTYTVASSNSIALRNPTKIWVRGSSLHSSGYADIV